jgi:hypothetical protein
MNAPTPASAADATAHTSADAASHAANSAFSHPARIEDGDRSFIARLSSNSIDKS